jgi:predicted nucleotidyltransferase component of viral defense system
VIPKKYIIEWTDKVQWQELYQIEQDLIITRALLSLYKHPVLKTSLAFRGGTALNKIFFNPLSRYSEDIDLVQTIAEPIGETINLIREVMDTWLGTPKRSFSEGLMTLAYRTESDEGVPLKLKLEINTREHFTVLGFQDQTFSSGSSWCPGDVQIRTYKLTELLGSKLRALYQRRKGRDLYDLHMALVNFPDLATDDIIRCF